MPRKTVEGRSGTSPVKYRPLERLTAVSRALTYAASLEDVLQITVRTAAEMLRAERVALMLEEDDGPLCIRAALGVEPEVIERFRESLDEELPSRLTTVFGENAKERFLGTPLIARGRIIGLLAVLLPGTRRERRDEWLLSALADQASVALENERQRAANTDLEERLKALEVQDVRQEQALRVVRHDLRTPLGAIRGYVELLQQEVYGPLTERQRTALDRLWVATSHLDSLVENALEMSRLQAGEVSVRCQPVDVRTVVEEAVGLVELQARDAAIDIRVDVSEDLEAWADASRLRQVLVQLLDNALKYSPPHSTVFVSGQRQEEGRTEVLTIRVADEGPGIDDVHAEEIFEPYRRFGPGMGSGLGLAIARAVTDLMSGELVLDADVAPGATFAVRLSVP